MHNTDIKQTVTQLVDFIVNDSTKNQLGISLTHHFWPSSKSWDPMVAEIDDFGDYHTFVAWAGFIFQRPDWVDFPLSQLKIWQSLRADRSIFPTSINLSSPKNSSTKIASLYDFQDTILGFYELALLTHNQIYTEELKRLIKLFSTVASRNNKLIPNKIFIPLFLSLPWSLSSPLTAGLVAEHLFLLSNSNKQKSYSQLAQKIIRPWISHSAFKNHSLICSNLFSYLPQINPSTSTKIMKENSNLIYAMLQSPKQYHDELDQFFQKLVSFQHQSGGFFASYNYSDSSIISKYFDKTQNFAIIDLLIEASHRLENDKYLKIATRSANFWLAAADKKTKIIPDYIDQTGKYVFPIAKLDQSADFYSSLLRLYCKTNNLSYLKAGELGAKSLVDTFGQSTSGWWHRIINSTTGKPASDSDAPLHDRPVARNLTKYVGGALRFYLTLHQVKKGKNIYTDEILWTMSRDR